MPLLSTTNPISKLAENGDWELTTVTPAMKSD